jgi:hypothetical protein
MKSEAFNELHDLARKMIITTSMASESSVISIYVGRMWMMRDCVAVGWSGKARQRYADNRERSLDAIVRLDDTEWKRIRRLVLDYDTLHSDDWHSYISGWLCDLDTVRAFG